MRPKVALRWKVVLSVANAKAVAVAAAVVAVTASAATKAVKAPWPTVRPLPNRW
jgi:hypothetical protein